MRQWYALVWLGMLAFNSSACLVDEDPEALAQKLSITSSSDRIDTDDDVRVMTTLGSIQNLSDACAKNIVVEVSYYDAKQQLVDVLTQTLSQVTVPSQSNVLFRVRGQLSAPSELYVSSKVRIVAADVKLSAARAPAKPSVWSNTMLISWLPLIVIIGVWFTMYRKANGPKAPATRAVALMDEQLKLTAAQNQLLAELISVMQQPSTKSPTPTASNQP